MSRSFKRTIAFGKSTRGGQSRHTKTWDDYVAEKAIKADRPVCPQHYRHKLQSLEDYVAFVTDHCRVNSRLSSTYDRRRFACFLAFLYGRPESPELIRAYALKLFNKDRSK
ncbi:MAG: hypothetical protein II951_02115 [Bacteroidales bacterium]|nr:hypothetical protein [Bacteroidales bacterium]